MDELISKLLTLSRKKHSNEEDFQKFQDFVENLKFEQIEELLTQRILSFDAPQILNSIFLGLSLKNASQKKRVKIFELILDLLQTKDIPSASATGLISWLIVELEKLSVTHLVRICDLCVDYVSKSDSSQHTSWKDIIPKILGLLVVKKEVDHYGSEMTGEKYKSEVITALVQAKWHKSILTSVADMFIHIPLSAEEHNRILGKLLTSLEGLEPMEVPPLAHNLLLLTKTNGLVPVLFALNAYYQEHLYGKSPTSKEIQVDLKETVESECVILYHIRETVKDHSGAGQQVLKAARLSATAPHLWLQPFLLAALLTVSNIPPNGVQVLDLVKGMVVRLTQEEEMLREYGWLRKLELETADPEQVFTKLIKSEVCGQEGVLRGLVSLGMSLLGKSKDSGRKVARLGRLIAVNLVSRHPYVAGHLIATITDSIISDPTLNHYTDCLCELCDTAPLVVLEYMPSVGRLLEELPTLPVAAAYRLSSAIVSLFKVSHKVRDALILILRKALFAHNVNARKVAVIGFLQLLKRMKMKGFSSLSQNSFQVYTCPSIFTQSALEVHSQSSGGASSNNEGICLEVINVLKRCFGQQTEVKLCLYEGVTRALLQNPDLCIPTSEIFIAHLRLFYESDLTVLPPLRITEAVVISGDSVVVKEPLGHLVFAVQQIIITSEQLMAGTLDNDDYSQNKNKIFHIMDSLVERFALCSPKTLDLEEETEEELELARREEILKLSIAIAEALIAYFLWKWDLSVTVDKSSSLLALYRAHSGFLDFAKDFKTQKKDKDKKTQTQKKPGAPKKAIFVTPPSILDFETIHRLLELLLSESVDWCADDVLENVQGRRPLHRYAMGSCASVLAKARSQLADYKPRSTFTNLVTLGGLLFEKVMKEIPKLMEFDPASAVLGVENYTEVFSLIAEHFPSQLSKFLADTCGVAEKEGLNDQLERVIKSYLKSLGKILDMDEEEEDQNHKKLMSALVAGVNTICLQLPVTGPCITKVVGWLSEVVEKRVISSYPDCKCILSLLITLSHRTKPDSSLYDNLALHLATLYGTINEVEIEKSDSEFAMVNDETKGLVLPLICSSVNSRLASLDWLVQRTRAEFLLLATTQAHLSDPTYKLKMKEKEREVIVQAGFMSSTCQILACIKSPKTGELLCRTLHRLYASLSALTKYFQARSSHANPAYQEARFGKLVKLAANHLSSQLADFLLFVESTDNVGEERKKISNRMLRDARKQADYIPKLVAELENFTKWVTQLSIKCKDPSLTANLKLTTTRDFRLNTRKLEELIKEQQEGDDETTVTETSISVSGSQVVEKEKKKPGRKRKAAPQDNPPSQSQPSTSQAPPSKPTRKRAKK